MSVDSPVRPAPEAPVTRCTRPPVRRVAVAPARALDRNAPPVARAAPPVRRTASDSRMYPVFLLLASAATRPSAKAAGIRTFMLRDE
jgi:hypothetical protein